MGESLDGWHGPFNDFAGRPYYVNTGTNQASSHDPRVEEQYIFELQSSFISTLEDVLSAEQPVDETPDTPGRHWHGRDSFGPTMERTAEGAEVLVLDGSGGGGGLTPREVALKKLATFRDNARVYHTSMLHHMGKGVEWIIELREEEEEAQRLKMAKLAEARRRRKFLKAN